VGIERKCDRGNARRVGLTLQTPKQPLMTAMNGVEISDRDVSTAGKGWKVTDVGDRDHRQVSPIIEGANRPGRVVVL
jgi:hypothetical protein